MKRTRIVLDLGNGQNLQTECDTTHDGIGWDEEVIFVDAKGLRNLTMSAIELDAASKKESAA